MPDIFFEQQPTESNASISDLSDAKTSEAKTLYGSKTTQAPSANDDGACSAAPQNKNITSAKNSDDVYLKYFVRQLRSLCRLRNVSYSELARGSGVSRSYLNDILAEKTNPNLRIMAAISDYFSLPLSYMLNAPKKSSLGLEEGQRRYLIAMTENEWLVMQNARLSRINEEFAKKKTQYTNDEDALDNEQIALNDEDGDY